MAEIRKLEKELNAELQPASPIRVSLAGQLELANLIWIPATAMPRCISSAPAASTATCAALPDMSLVPFAPFAKAQAAIKLISGVQL